MIAVAIEKLPIIDGGICLNAGNVEGGVNSDSKVTNTFQGILGPWKNSK